MVSSRTDDIVAIVERITTLHGLRLSGLELQRLSLTQLAQQAVDVRRKAAAKARLALEVEHAEEAPAVQGNAERLLQAIDSLLDNAIKFNRPGGCITVRVGEREGLVSMEVADTGIGIPADKIDQVWDTFYQIDGSTTRRYGGLGVGLALVKDVIEAHGGAVWVRSTEGQGSTFGFGLRRAA
jgi:signal transduction histidine kinase